MNSMSYMHAYLCTKFYMPSLNSLLTIPLEWKLRTFLHPINRLYQQSSIVFQELFLFVMVLNLGDFLHHLKHPDHCWVQCELQSLLGPFMDP